DYYCQVYEVSTNVLF
nr:immunoglobulin light chain junction region [Macaca mulatta]